MKRRLVYLFTLIVCSAGASVLLFLALRNDTRGEFSAPVPPSLSVKQTLLTRERWPRTLSAVGTVAAWQEVVIGAEIGGQRLLRLRVDVGDWVEQGQVLAELGLGTLEAELNASTAALEEAEIHAAELARAAGRARVLQSPQVLSAQAIEQAQAAADAAQARLAAARARVQADSLRLAYTQVRAPNDGVITARPAVEGMLVHAGAEIMRLQRQGRLEWRAELPGSDLVRVTPGQRAVLSLGGDEGIEGQVRLVAPQVDPHSRTGLVYVDLPSDARLRAGLYARGDFLLGHSEVLTLPESAVLLRDGFSYVFRLEDDRVWQQKVRVGARRNGRVEIREGLAVDTPVVESGVGFLAHGLTVRVVHTPAPLR